MIELLYDWVSWLSLPVALALLFVMVVNLVVDIPTVVFVPFLIFFAVMSVLNIYYQRRRSSNA